MIYLILNNYNSNNLNILLVVNLLRENLIIRYLLRKDKIYINLINILCLKDLLKVKLRNVVINLVRILIGF